MKAAEREFRERQYPAALETHRKSCKGTYRYECSQARLEIKLSCLLSSETHPTAPESLGMAMWTGCDSWKILRRDLVRLLRHNMVLFSLVLFSLVSFSFYFHFISFIFMQTCKPGICYCYNQTSSFYTYSGNQVLMLRTVTHWQRLDFRENPGPTLLESVLCESHSDVEKSWKFSSESTSQLYCLAGYHSFVCAGAAHQKIFLPSTQKTEIRSAKSCPCRARKNPLHWRYLTGRNETLRNWISSVTSHKHGI